VKTVTILFSDIHLSYSPTVIGLYDLLSELFEVRIVAKSPRSFDNKPVTGRNVVYLPDRRSLIRKIVNRSRFAFLAVRKKEFRKLKRKGTHYSVLEEYDFICDLVSHGDTDIVIAVDFKNLFFAQLMGRNVEFLSLEIKADDPFYESCDFENINSVIIQTVERYKHLFNGAKFKTFYIQNAPNFRPSSIELERRGLVYCGTAWDAFGFYHILEFLRCSSSDTLTVKGAILDEDRRRIDSEYVDLIAAGRLMIEDDYLDDTEVVEYLRKVRVGFCFYNFEIDRINTFNYLSAPSGKMFKYFAAGVPVVAQDTIGMKPIKEFDCGVLINDLRPETIKAAVEMIEKDFDRYSQNCLEAAEHYSLDKAAKPFIEYLQRSTPE